jgi:hypothetical protein
MATSDVFAKMMDEWAQSVLSDDDPYQLILRSTFLDFAVEFDYDVAARMDRARWDISELADAPWGPQSMELCISTTVEFARGWIGLNNRENDANQSEFFENWIKKAQDRLTNPRT